MNYTPRQYAHALSEELLFGSAGERAEIADALRSLGMVLRDASVRAALLAPGLSEAQRVQVAQTIVEAIFKGSVKQIQALTGLLVQLAGHRALHMLRSIASHIDSSDRVVIALADHTHAASTEPLQKKFHQAETEAKIEENPALIGGFVLSRGNDVLDMSLAAALNTIRSQILQSH